MKNFMSFWNLALLILLQGIGLSAAKPGSAQIIVPVIDQSQVDVTVSSDVQFDSTTNLYTYSYEVASSGLSVQNVMNFAVEVGSGVSNIQSPQGWSARAFSSAPVIRWAATEVEPLPPDFVDTGGNIPPSPFDIKPGETLGGFSFQSSEPPETVAFYAQGFAPIPEAVSEDDFDEIKIPGWMDNSFRGSTTGPALFSDGFESGDTSAWSSTVPQQGTP